MKHTLILGCTTLLMLACTACESESDPTVYCWEITTTFSEKGAVVTVVSRIIPLTVKEKNEYCDTGSYEGDGMKLVTEARRLDGNECALRE